MTIVRHYLWLLVLVMLPACGGELVSKSLLGGVAIGGKDPVAYRRLSRDDSAIEGRRDLVVDWKGASWRFASAEAAAKFQADPQAFVPAYNGHCANALSKGNGLVKTDGRHWLVLDDQRLYLFYSASGRERWLSGDHAAFRVQADAAWQSLSAAN